MDPSGPDNRSLFGFFERHERRSLVVLSAVLIGGLVAISIEALRDANQSQQLCILGAWVVGTIATIAYEVVLARRGNLFARSAEERDRSREQLKGNAWKSSLLIGNGILILVGAIVGPIALVVFLAFAGGCVVAFAPVRLWAACFPQSFGRVGRNAT